MSAENSRYPLPAHVEWSKPPVKLRPGFEIAAARNVVKSDIKDIKGMAEKANLTDSWIEGLTHPNWENVSEVIKEGFKANREISRRDGLSYALGGVPDKYFGEMPYFVDEEVKKGTVDRGQTTRPVAEVKKAYDTVSKSIEDSLEIQTAVETLRLLSVDLQDRGGEDFKKLSILFYTEDRIGKLEALDYALGEENATADIVNKSKE